LPSSFSLSTKSLNEKKLYFFLALFVLFLDQLTKQWAVNVLDEGRIQAFLPYFNFTLLYNPGAAFSFLSDAGGWQRWFFTVIALVVCVFLIFWILKLAISNKLELTALSFILGGALGNLIDRILWGKVVDFVDWFYSSAGECLPLFYPRFELQTCHWPAFNIADAALLFGVFLMIIDMFKTKKEGVE
jgi:signal peptidase II